MAELALAIVSGPSSLVGIVELCRFIHKRLSALKSAPQSLEHLRIYTYELQQGTLKLGLDVLGTLLAEGSLPEDATLQMTATSHVDRIHGTLAKINAILEKCIDAEDGSVNRLFFVSRGERELKRLSGQLQTSQVDFGIFVAIVDAKRRVKGLERLLTWRRLQTIDTAAKARDESDGSYIYGPVPGAPHALTARAEFKGPHGLREFVVLLERPGLRDAGQDAECSTGDYSQKEVGNSYEELCIVADYLSDHLVSENAVAGILPCLGYRKRPSVELVFQVPDGLIRPRSLSDLMASWALNDRSQRGTQDDGAEGRTDGGNIDPTTGVDNFRTSKLRLGKQLCNAVNSVQRAGIVHKSIRPETIILFEVGKKRGNDTLEGDFYTSEGGGTPLHFLFLSNWNMLRAAEDPSSRTMDDDWIKNIYRHPERQGLQIERRYNINHDIYSLGVCLLEIGLWDPLITGDRGNAKQKMSALFERTAGKLGFLDHVDPEAVHERLTKPSTVRKVLRAMATDELPSVMGRVYSTIVLFCLDCMEKKNREGQLDGKGTRPSAMTSETFSDTVLQQMKILLT